MKTFLVDAVNTFVVDKCIFQEMYDLLEQYPNRKIVVTNTNDEQMGLFGLQNLPYEVFTLKHAPDKTDPGYFQTLLQTFAILPEEIVYFEHNPEAVKSAQSVGITSYHYDPNKKDLAGLKRFLDASL